ncbi:MAG: hypothetical protein JWO03_1160 [Bacteroidetes bacterium]|nr:hypothetical protein [Bacteroidota bacterium]
MKRAYLLYGIVVSLFALTGCGKHAGDYEQPTISGGLSFEHNPSGDWQVGYSADTSLALDMFRLSTYADTSNIIGVWHPASGPSGYYPYVAQNRDTVTRVEPNGHWAARSGQLAMEASGTGQYSIVRYVVPVSGRYVLSATFEGIHYNLSSTDVHILMNATHLLDDQIDGYGGDPAYHAITGTHPSSSYRDTLQLQQHDILTFAVGYGANKTNYNDTNGLLVWLERL